MSTGSVRMIKMFLTAITMFFLFGMTCQAEEVYQNPDTGYTVVVDDTEELLYEVKRTQMIDIMKEITEYGNVIFWSEDVGRDSEVVPDRAKEHYTEVFGEEKGIILFIGKRFLNPYIYVHPKLQDVITPNHVTTITKNGMEYCKADLYGAGAVEVYTQILSLLQKQGISQPMKFVSNTLLGFVVGLLLTYAGVSWWYRQHLPQLEDKAEMFLADIRFQDIRMNSETTEETYYPLGTIFRAYPKEIDNLGYGQNVDNHRGGFRR